VIYAAGFLAMQFLSCTLATKIPSFLAAHLAHQLTGMEHKARTEEISRDIRLSVISQAVSFIGNVVGLVPFGLLVVFALSLVGLPLFSPAEGRVAVAEVHPWKSMALPLGALTGVELWLSSLAGGWFENWLVFQRVPEAIREHPALKRVLGAKRATGLAEALFKHSSGVAANVGLGFLFAFVPLIGVFIGLNTESRHVTISSTSTLLGLSAMEPGSITASMLTWAMLGLVGIGVMNFLVSFFLALSVAANATGVRRARLHRFFNPFRRRAKA
jgi:site-specific recombinase